MEEGKTAASANSSSGSNPKTIPEKVSATDQDSNMEVTDHSIELEDTEEVEVNDSRIIVTVQEAGMLDHDPENVLMEVDDASKSSCTQDKELGVDQSPAGSASESSTEAGNSEERIDGSSLSFTIKQCNEPQRMLYVYKKSTEGSDVVIDVVSMTARDASDVAVVQSGMEEDPEREEKEKEEGEEVEKASTASKATEDIPEYTCNQCNFTTKKKHLRLSHEILHAVPDKEHLFHCTECSYSTRQRFNLKTHVKSHFDIKEMDPSELFKCTKCDYVSMYKYDLQTHLKKHDPEKHFRCFHCDFTSIYKHSVLHHISSKHNGVRPFQCSLCSYSAAKKTDLETHMFKHDDQKRYKCSECDYKTTYKHCLQSHMNIHRGDKPFQCTWAGCSFSTNSKSNLNAHITGHNRRSRCESCGYESRSAEKFTNHTCLETKKRKEINKRICMTKVAPPSKKEDGKLEYRCQECGYVSKNKHSMKRHSQIHNAERERPDKVHQCIHCNYATAYKSSLTRHMARHALVKPFKCGHCDYSAITMSQMHTHIAKHTGIKQYACEHCSYSTANKQHLTNHMAKHSNIRYKCNICGHITAWKDRLRVHLKQHERGQIVSRSVKSPPQSGSSTGMHTLSEEGSQLVTTDGQVLQVLNVISSEDFQNIEGSQTLVVMNQLADRIQNDINAIHEEKDQGETVTQGEDQSEPQNEGDIIVVGGEKIIDDQQDQILVDRSELASQRDVGDGNLMIIKDHGGTNLHLHLSSKELENSKSASTYSLEFSSESAITDNTTGIGETTQTIKEIST